MKIGKALQKYKTLNDRFKCSSMPQCSKKNRLS